MTELNIEVQYKTHINPEHGTSHSIFELQYQLVNNSVEYRFQFQYKKFRTEENHLKDYKKINNLTMQFSTRIIGPQQVREF